MNTTPVATTVDFYPLLLRFHALLLSILRFCDAFRHISTDHLTIYLNIFRFLLANRYVTGVESMYRTKLTGVYPC